ncbi:MAG TPA: hypothetical protein VGB76_10060 [Pyrinomonadaceae bacterium]|jgi:hypothetical protein
MNVAKNGIRVIKREEREQRAQQKMETTKQETEAETELRRTQERELASSVAEWVNDFLRRRHGGFPEEMGGQLRALFER